MQTFKPKPRASSSHQVRQMILSACKVPASSYYAQLDEPVSETLNQMIMADRLRLPFTHEAVELVTERWPLLQDLGGKRSKLFKALTAHTDCVLLLIDSMISGRDALYFATYAQDMDEVENWVRSLTVPDLTARPTYDGASLIISPLTAFVI